MALLIFLAPAASANLSREDVYYGDARRYTRPVEINAKKVFMAIPAYKEIIDKNIPEDSALYFSKLDEANKRFTKAVKTYAEANKCDLVCEEGRLEGAANVTDDVIKIIQAQEDEKP